MKNQIVCVSYDLSLSLFLPVEKHTPPSSMCITPRMSNSAGQLNNNIHTVFTHLGLHFLRRKGGSEIDPNLGWKPHKVQFTINATAVVAGIRFIGGEIY